MAKTDYKKFLPVKTVIRIGKNPAKIRKKSNIQNLECVDRSSEQIKRLTRRKLVALL
jgi:hypothetical protein